MESLMMSEMKEFCDEWKVEIKNGCGLVRIDYQFDLVFFNVVWCLVSGKRYARGDPVMQKLLGATKGFLESTKVGGGVAGLFPGLINYFPKWSGYSEYTQNCEQWIQGLQVRGIFAGTETDCQNFSASCYSN